MYNSSPGTFAKGTALKRKRKVDKQRSNKRCRKALFVGGSASNEIDYGLAAQQPDIDDNLMEKEKEEFLKSLKSEEEIDRIQKERVGQSNFSKWLEIRRNILTASNFGRVCKMRANTGRESIVRQLLYSAIACEAMEYGRRNEESTQRLGKDIKKCGIFIDRDHSYLRASPDGLVNDDATVEIIFHKRHDSR